jgi:plasmid stabilization system protein ParE
VRVTFNELAERELNEAAPYYELEHLGLGAAFITAIQRCTESIQAHPQAAPVVRGQIRSVCASDFRTVCSTPSPATRFECSQ